MKTNQSKRNQKVVAYGHGGVDPDKVPTYVVHVACWDSYAGPQGNYRLSFESAYFPGAEEFGLKGRICAHCGKTFAATAAGH